MSTKTATIVRKNGKPFIDKILVQKQDESVEWSINEDTEFEIFFPPGKDPLVPGTDLSTGHRLKREIDPNVPRGQQKKYQYRIKLLRTKEEVEGNSPPEMEIQ